MKPRMPNSPPADADDHFVLDDQRRMRDAHSPASASATVDVPHHAAGLRIESDQVRVERAHEQRVAEDRQAAVDAAAAGRASRRTAVVSRSRRPARARVERDHVIRRFDGVHHAVDDQRRGFELLERLRLPHPLQLQVEILDVGRRDLRSAGCERWLTLPE